MAKSNHLRPIHRPALHCMGHTYTCALNVEISVAHFRKIPKACEFTNSIYSLCRFRCLGSVGSISCAGDIKRKSSHNLRSGIL